MADADDEALERRRRKLAADRLAVEEEELELKRRKLQRDRQALDAQEHSNILRLNVGGQIFDTTPETMLSGGSAFFGRLLDAGDGPGHEVRGAVRDSDGRLFIDRSPAGFQLILEYLRGSLDVYSLDKEKKEALISEALYYDLPGLVSALHGGYDASALSADDQKIRSDAMAFRTALSQGQDGAAAEADLALCDVFGSNDGAAISYDAEAAASFTCLPAMPILFNTEAVQARRNRIDSCRTLAGFRARLDAFAGPLFAGLDMTNLVVAGGAVFHALLLGNPVGDNAAARTVRREAADGKSDIDIFIVAEDEATARAAFDRVVAHFKARLAADALPGVPAGAAVPARRELVVVRSHLAVSLYAGHPQRTVQVILRRHSCVADVIFGFDVDACQLAYDGSYLRWQLLGRTLPTTPWPHPSYHPLLQVRRQRRVRHAVRHPGLPHGHQRRRPGAILQRLRAAPHQVRDARLRRGGPGPRARARGEPAQGRRLHVGARPQPAQALAHLWRRGHADVLGGHRRHRGAAQASRSLRAARPSA